MMFSWPGVRKTKEFGLGFVCMCVCLNLLFISVCGNVQEFTRTEKKKKNTRLFTGNQHCEAS